MQANNPAKVFFGLDSLRGFAALFVMLFHARDLLHIPWLAQTGGLAVDLFFTMSGFVIAHAYEKSLKCEGVTGFATRRFVRLYPLYVLGTGFGAIEYLFHNQFGSAARLDLLISLMCALVFLPSFSQLVSDGILSPLNAASWSLLYEVYVNIIYAILFPFLNTRLLVVIMVASAASLIHHGTSYPGFFTSEFLPGFARVSFSFAAGVLMFRLTPKMARFRLPALSVELFLLVYLSMPDSAIHDYAFVFLISPLAVWLRSNDLQLNALARYGAATSYCIYMIQVPALEFVGGASHRLHINSIAPTLFLLLLLLVVCPMIDRFYDRPIRQYLSRKLGIQRAGSVPGGS